MRAAAGAARLVNGTAEEIAIVKNIDVGGSELRRWRWGLTGARAIRLSAFEEEFPANQCIPWQRLQSKGVRIEWLPVAAAPLERIEQARREGLGC